MALPGAEEAFDTMRYPPGNRAHRPRRLPGRPQAEQEGHQRGQGQRAGNLPVLEDVVTEGGQQYPDVELQHMYVDNAAMQLVKAPRRLTWS